MEMEVAVRRAAAEGYTFAAIKNAIKAFSDKNVAEATKVAVAGNTMSVPVEFTGMVDVLTSKRYCGGYMRWGARVMPGDFQERVGDRDDRRDPNPAGAAEWLQSAQDGAIVTCEFDYRDKVKHTYQKRNGVWHIIHTFDSSDIERAAEPFYPGIRSDVTSALGCGMSSAFNALFDKAVEELF